LFHTHMHRPPAWPYPLHDFIEKQKVVSFSRTTHGLSLLHRVLPAPR
jgi:hypothetical protein